jgi:spermidine synthase
MRLFLVGLLALLCQVVLLRELNVAFYGVELVYAVALAAWMAGGAAGSALLPRRFGATVGDLSWLLAATAAALPAEVAVVRVSRLALGGVPGAYLPFEQQVLVLAAAVLPASLTSGIAFRWAAELAAERGRSLAWAYAVESGGAGVGAALATLAFAFGVQTFAVAVLVAGLVPSALLAVVRRRLWLPALLLTAVATFFTPGFDLRMTAWSHPSVVDSRDSAYARITATAAGNQTALFVDDVLVYESETARQEELAHIAALQHPAPRRILLLGGSVERLDRELRQHRPERLDVVEMDAVYLDVAGRQRKSGSAIVIDDPRAFLRRAGPYDLIVVATAQPTSGQSNRFYTAEFFAECRSRLASGGIVAFTLDMPENVLTPLASHRAASILAAVGSAFPFVEVLPGASAVVTASREPLPGTAAALTDRWRARRLTTRLVTPAYLEYLFENDRRETLRRLVTDGTSPNTDARPIAYQIAAATWLSKFFPELAGVRGSDRGSAAFAPGASAPRKDPRYADRGSKDPRYADRGSKDPRYVLVAAVVITFALARWRRGVRIALLAGVAGFSGMVLETVLLLAYQARSGALYERLGILLTAFMAGLAVGAWGVGRAVAIGQRSWGVRWSSAALLAASTAMGVLTATLVLTGAAMGIVLTGVMLFGVGATVAGVFACAAAATAADGNEAPGRLYGADLAGGALGSLLAGLVLVPMAGLAPTAWLVAALGALALLLV